MRSQRGITGLETAIILIAFVLVGSVFAFTVLSSGVQASEQSKIQVRAGLRDIQNTLSLKGATIGYAAKLGSSDVLYKISFTVTAALPGEGVDLTPPYTAGDSGIDPDVVTGAQYATVISYLDKDQYLSDVPWTVRFIGSSNGDKVLDHNEIAEISVWLLDRDTAKTTSQNDSAAYMNGTSDGGGNGGFTSTNTPVVRGKEFTLEIRPPKGQVLSLNRTLPDSVTTVMDLR
jgi:flagellin-like protein